MDYGLLYAITKEFLHSITIQIFIYLLLLFNYSIKLFVKMYSVLLDLLLVQLIAGLATNLNNNSKCDWRNHRKNYNIG
jgi:hypothetical protein